ncbi:hypothetical protein [Yoonia sp. BS5-3]|uniref:DUF1127 domain-containing protein n=1 Tax=Yoonia phaeophyticola TaxID=3137369 RepID=A0ABZ2V6F4_9RHOB
MKIMTTRVGKRDRFAKFPTRFNAGFSKQISDHQARDIGLSVAELARLRFVWPSESADHPLL